MNEEDSPGDNKSEDDKKALAAFVPPTDGSWVPRERFDAVNFEVQRLREEVQTVKTVDKLPITPKHSRAQLLEMVEDGDISQTEADSRWETQIEERVAQRFEDTLKARDTQRGQEAILQDYIKALPELDVQNSEIAIKVGTEFNYMTKTLGMPETEGTMAAAIRTIVGPLSSLVTGKARTKVPDSFSDTQGSSGSDEFTSKDKWFLDLGARQKAYYKKAVDRGGYADWDAVKKELEYKR